ncbi:MAG: hypothetical protein U1F43_25875 [Myxococcota bacterium]
MPAGFRRRGLGARLPPMCHFISATVPGDASLEALGEIVAPFEVGLRPYSNASLASHLRPGERLASTTLGPCDCGTALGSVGRTRAESPLGEAEVRKLAKKGWSPGKIERWLEQQRQTAARDDRVATERGVERARTAEADLQRWLDVIDALLDHGLPWVGLFFHWYRGGLSERIALRPDVDLERAEVGPDSLLALEEDTLYRVSRSAPRSTRRPDA